MEGGGYDRKSVRGILVAMEMCTLTSNMDFLLWYYTILWYCIFSEKSLLLISLYNFLQLHVTLHKLLQKD